MDSRRRDVPVALQIAATGWTSGSVPSVIDIDSSTRGDVGIDRLGALLDRFGVTAALIEAEPLRFPRLYGEGGVAPGGGHLHVLAAGVVELVHPDGRPEPARLTVSEPTLLLYPGPVRHQLLPVERADVTCAALEFARGTAHPLVRALPPLVSVSIAAIDGLAGALDLLTAETERVRCGQRVLASRLLDVILLQLLRWLLDHPHEAGVDAGLIVGMSDPGIAAALVAVHGDPGAPWTLERLAREAAMSRSAFAATFHALVGETPAAYVADFRIAITQQRLLGGEQLASFAHELGYANPSGLSRAFNTRTGQSPSAWLATQRNSPGEG